GGKQMAAFFYLRAAAEYTDRECRRAQGAQQNFLIVLDVVGQGIDGGMGVDWHIRQRAYDGAGIIVKCRYASGWCRGSIWSQQADLEAKLWRQAGQGDGDRIAADYDQAG